MARFKDWESFRAAHPVEAEFLEGESAKKSKFFAAMTELISTRKNLSVKQMNAIRDAAKRASEGVDAPSRNERVAMTLCVCKLKNAGDEFGDVAAYVFGRTPGGWIGRFHSESAALEAEFRGRGYLMPRGPGTAGDKVLVFPGVNVFVDARVAWRAPDGGFVILDDLREVRVEGEPVEHRSPEQEERKKKIAERPRASWRDSLKL